MEIKVRTKEQQAIDNLKAIVNSKDKIIEIEPPIEDTAQILLDYITNLQEELKYQKQAEQEYNEKHTKLMKKYKELQERKNKAIKYLEEPNRDNFDYSKANLLNILGGDDNE